MAKTLQTQLAESGKQNVWDQYQSGRITLQQAQAAIGGGGISAANPFNFNYEEEIKKSYESLKPYYDQIWNFTKGNIDLAKQYLSQTRDKEVKEATQQYGSAVAGQKVQFPQETEDLMTSLNRMGLMGGAGGGQASATGLAGVKLARTKEAQRIRAQDVEDIKETRVLGATQDYETGIKEQSLREGEEKTLQERQRRQESSVEPLTRFQIQSSIYGQKKADESAQFGRETESAGNLALFNLLGQGGQPSGSVSSTSTNTYTPTNFRQVSGYAAPSARSTPTYSVTPTVPTTTTNTSGKIQIPRSGEQLIYSKTGRPYVTLRR